VEECCEIYRLLLNKEALDINNLSVGSLSGQEIRVVYDDIESQEQLEDYDIFFEDQVDNDEEGTCYILVSIHNILTSNKILVKFSGEYDVNKDVYYWESDRFTIVEE